jgi:hypothetical protein
MTYPNRFTLQRPLRWMGALALAAGLAACGGGGSSSNDAAAPVNPPKPPAPVATELFGTAAVGAPIAGGKVEVRCQGGATLLTATTTATGTWQVDTTGQALPCAVRVTGGSLAQGQAYYSVALAFGTLNVTPLTDLMVANAAARTPAAWWGGSGPADPSAVTQAALDRALAALRTAFGLAVLKDLDPRTAQFTAQPKDRIDDVLEALRLALPKAGMDYAALVQAALGQGFVLPESFRTVLASSYVTVTTGGSTPDPVPGPGGSYTLTLNVTASGMALAPITLTNMPKPASQSEFCGWVDDPSSPLSLTQVSNGATGKVVINGCAFNGTVGRVDATLTITSPVAMTVPYSVTYTYR